MISFIDLYAGIGGTRLGLEQAANVLNLKTQCVFSSEIDKYCIETYITNFGPTNFFGDISKIKSKKLIQKKIPKFDFLLAGFPCQPFSKAGLKKGFNDERGKHFFTINKILEQKKPKVFLLENVAYLKKHDDGKTLKKILHKLRKNYFVPEPQILNAKDFGLPQNRNRIFILGFLKSLKINEFNYPVYNGPKKKVKSILDKKFSKELVISNKLWVGHVNRKKYYRKKGRGFGYHMVNKNSAYTRTLSARYHKDGGEILVETSKNKNPRFLSVNECKKLQGFPSYFNFKHSRTRSYMQLGNSVPVPVIKFICIEILKTLIKNKYLKGNFKLAA